VHDELYVRAMVVCDGAIAMAVVSCDVLGFFRKTALAAKSLAARESGVPAGNILLAATHTHSAPALIVVASEFMGGPWFEEFCRGVAEAVRTARASLEPAELEYAKGQCDLSANRRVKTEDGIGFGQDFAKPRDPELILVEATASDGRVLGRVVNYACHPVVLGKGNTLISADYPGVISRTLEQQGPAPCLFLNGTCGDIDPSLHGSHWVNKHLDDLHVFGRALADKCQDLLNGPSTTIEPCNVGMASKVLRLPLAPAPDGPVAEVDFRSETTVERRLSVELGDIDAARRRIARARDKHRNWRLCAESFVDARYGIVAEDRHVVTEIQFATIGHLAFCALPGEVLVGIGLAVKNSAGTTRPCIIATCANDYIGYLPEVETFREGGFESWQCILSDAGIQQFNEEVMSFFSSHMAETEEEHKKQT